MTLRLFEVKLRHGVRVKVTHLVVHDEDDILTILTNTWERFNEGEYDNVMVNVHLRKYVVNKKHAFT